MEEVEAVQVAVVNKELEEAYVVFSTKLFAFADKGLGIDLFNFDEVIKEVMEAVEVLGTVKVMSGKQKSAVAQDFALRVLTDLHMRGKISDNFFTRAKDTMQYIGPAIFTIVAMASQGKVLINQAVQIAESAGCDTTSCKNSKCCVL
jgi:hypothetical protein